MTDIVCYDSTGSIFDHFTQWDINQKLLITGADTSSEPDFHFYNKFSKTAMVVPGAVSTNGITVVVPNILLQESEPIIADIVYTAGDSSSGTRYTLRFPVRPKPMPDSQVYTDLVTTVQRAGGTLQTNSSGTANIFCAFEPDTVVLYCGSYEKSGLVIRCDLSAVFSESVDNATSDLRRVATYSPEGNALGYPFINAIIQRNSSGFIVDRVWYSNTAGSEKTLYEKAFSYIALKYT